MKGVTAAGNADFHYLELAGGDLAFALGWIREFLGAASQRSKD